MDFEQKQQLYVRGIWVTRDGHVVPVSEMTDSHLLNLRAHLLKQEQQALYEEDCEYAMIGKSMMHDIDDYDGTTVSMPTLAEAALSVGDSFPIWEHLEAEIARRGLMAKAG